MQLGPPVLAPVFAVEQAGAVVCAGGRHPPAFAAVVAIDLVGELGLADLAASVTGVDGEVFIVVLQIPDQAAPDFLLQAEVAGGHGKPAGAVARAAAVAEAVHPGAIEKIKIAERNIPVGEQGGGIRFFFEHARVHVVTLERQGGLTGRSGRVEGEPLITYAQLRLQAEFQQVRVVNRAAQIQADALLRKEVVALQRYVPEGTPLPLILHVHFQGGLIDLEAEQLGVVCCSGGLGEHRLQGLQKKNAGCHGSPTNALPGRIHWWNPAGTGGRVVCQPDLRKNRLSPPCGLWQVWQAD